MNNPPSSKKRTGVALSLVFVTACFCSLIILLAAMNGSPEPYHWVSALVMVMVTAALGVYLRYQQQHGIRAQEQQHTQLLKEGLRRPQGWTVAEVTQFFPKLNATQAQQILYELAALDIAYETPDPEAQTVRYRFAKPNIGYTTLPKVKAGWQLTEVLGLLIALPFLFFGLLFLGMSFMFVTDQGFNGASVVIIIFLGLFPTAVGWWISTSIQQARQMRRNRQHLQQVLGYCLQQPVLSPVDLVYISHLTLQEALYLLDKLHYKQLATKTVDANGRLCYDLSTIAQSAQERQEAQRLIEENYMLERLWVGNQYSGLWMIGRFAGRSSLSALILLSAVALFFLGLAFTIMGTFELVGLPVDDKLDREPVAAHYLLMLIVVGGGGCLFLAYLCWLYIQKMYQKSLREYLHQSLLNLLQTQPSVLATDVAAALYITTGEAEYRLDELHLAGWLELKISPEGQKVYTAKALG
jgi:hypothetical protein